MVAVHGFERSIGSCCFGHGLPCRGFLQDCLLRWRPRWRQRSTAARAGGSNLHDRPRVLGEVCRHTGDRRASGDTSHGGQRWPWHPHGPRLRRRRHWWRHWLPYRLCWCWRHTHGGRQRLHRSRRRRRQSPRLLRLNLSQDLCGLVYQGSEIIWLLLLLFKLGQHLLGLLEQVSEVVHELQILWRRAGHRLRRRRRPRRHAACNSRRYEAHRTWRRHKGGCHWRAPTPHRRRRSLHGLRGGWWPAAALAGTATTKRWRCVPERLWHAGHDLRHGANWWNSGRHERLPHEHL
mmetsp:Transcript_134794/g.340884  ORF Transcript_134794/g.340884 Transcript_134794/m.340884 type:complete len:291 (-) Transcript_134794:1552-2424(-)